MFGKNVEFTLNPLFIGIGCLVIHTSYYAPYVKIMEYIYKKLSISILLSDEIVIQYLWWGPYAYTDHFLVFLSIFLGNGTSWKNLHLFDNFLGFQL